MYSIIIQKFTKLMMILSLQKSTFISISWPWKLKIKVQWSAYWHAYNNPNKISEEFWNCSIFEVRLIKTCQVCLFLPITGALEQETIKTFLKGPHTCSRKRPISFPFTREVQNYKHKYYSKTWTRWKEQLYSLCRREKVKMLVIK